VTPAIGEGYIVDGDDRTVEGLFNHGGGPN
jgi:hypothetical protein